MSAPPDPPKLFTLRREYSLYELEWAATAHGEEDPAAALLRDRYHRRPLAADWEPPPVVIERSEGDPDESALSDERPDIYEIDLEYAATGAAKAALEPLFGPHAEFLPLEVAGERPRRDQEAAPAPPDDPPALFLINPLTEVPLGAGSISHEMAYRRVTWYTFRPADVAGLPVFRAAGDIEVIVSDEARRAILAAGLRGLEFSPLDWRPASRLPAKRKPKKKPPKRVDPPELLPEADLAAAGAMTDALWENARAHWKWACDAARARGGTVDRRVRVSKPISERQLDALRDKVGGPLPADFEHLLTHYARKVGFSWDVADAPLADESPDELRDCVGCFEDLWDVATLPGLEAAAEKIRRNSVGSFGATYEARLPFIEVGNGDHLAFDLRGGAEGCPVVYLCHDDADWHERVLGRTFTDFLLRWSGVGCVGPDQGYFGPFHDPAGGRIDCHGALAGRWRGLMAAGA